MTLLLPFRVETVEHQSNVEVSIPFPLQNSAQEMSDAIHILISKHSAFDASPEFDSPILAGCETEHLPHRYQSDSLCKAYTLRKNKELCKNYTQIMRNSIPVCAASPPVLAELY